ncbi:hypothetical protein BDF22DRAFT_746509 [Syncephalis plumigaleata]|nr:hypothetical protein BDF22DRAFT_746509 [Syncephalis plumigaleata]
MKRTHRGLLYRASLSAFIIGASACLAGAAYDILNQAANDGRDYRSLLAIACSYFIMGVLATILSCTRLLTMRRAKHVIPRSVIPIRAEDLPRRVFVMIQKELGKVDQIRADIKPLPEESVQPGWGQPGSALDGVQFALSACETFDIIAEKAQLQLSIPQRTAGMTAHQYFDMLVAYSIIDRPIARVYVNAYETARFGQEPWTEAQYVDFMKLVTVILQRIQIAATGGQLM